MSSGRVVTGTERGTKIFCDIFCCVSLQLILGPRGNNLFAPHDLLFPFFSKKKNIGFVTIQVIEKFGEQRKRRCCFSGKSFRMVANKLII